MSRTGRRLVRDFLIPALDDKRYGKLLEWTDEDKRIFNIGWSHKNASSWQHDDTIVFQDWDKLKGHYRPETKGYFMQAKQRFRAALYKLDTVRRLSPPSKSMNLYQLINVKKDEKKKKGHETVGRPKKATKKVNQKSIPTSVIKKNTSYIEKSNECPKVSATPSSVSSSRNNKPKLGEIKMCYDEYMIASERQRLINEGIIKMHCNGTEEVSPIPKMYDVSMCQKNLVTEESPAVSIETIPVNYPRQPDVSQKRLESPLVFIVDTHIESAVKMEDGIMDYIMYTDSESDSGGALNLSVRLDDSEASSS